MKWTARSLLAALAAAALAIGFAPGAGAGGGPVYYLALGDSVAEGYQPIGGPWSPEAPPGHNQGYADQLFKLMREGYQQLRLEKLACGGESTRTLIEGPAFCPYAAGSQLDQAETFLQTHRGEVALITISIGGNDVIGREVDCLDDATLTIDVACVQGQLPSIQANISEILQRLRAPAPGVPIVGSNAYNPLLRAWVLVPAPIGPFLARASAVGVEVLNAGIEAAYAAEGVPVADLYGAFDAANFADTVATKEWGIVPLNVHLDVVLQQAVHGRRPSHDGGSRRDRAGVRGRHPTMTRGAVGDVCDPDERQTGR